jgi:hypothetical protein
MGIFSFLTGKTGKKAANEWLLLGWRRLQGEDYAGAVNAFNEVNKIYKVEDLNPHILSNQKLNEYISFVCPSFLGLALAYAGLNSLDIGKNKLAVVATLQMLYGADNPKDFMQKTGNAKLIKLFERIDSQPLGSVEVFHY